MRLSKIIADFEYSTTRSDICDVEIEDIVYDSRKAARGMLFVCLVGAVSDGHTFAKNAYDRGCRVFLVERKIALPDDALQVITPDTRLALALASSAFFDYPSRSLAIIGVTGTKGKTTTASLARDILAAGGINTAYIGTTGILINGERTVTKNTTPESYELHRAFRQMVESGVAAVVMEVSSQAVYMKRIAGIHFHIGVFTNLSRDHIGGVEHPTFEHYKACKAELFRQCRFGIFNSDDSFYTDMVKDSRSINSTFGVDPGQSHDVTANNIALWKSQNILGVKFTCRSMLGERVCELKMPGRFNVYNALAAIAIAERMQIPSDVINGALRTAAVPGRFEIVDALPNAVTIIDYAHNRASMEAALNTLRHYEPRRLVVLFGSIGDRAKERRAELGNVVSELADFGIITSDNPGKEDPEAILADIEKHMSCPYAVFADRHDAVKYAIDNVRDGDCILFAGKGHEKYQIINGEYVFFDEKAEILSAASDKVGARALRND